MLQRFRNGGSWSYFICPCCGRRARTLKLLNGQLLRSRCCRARGLLYKNDPMSVRQRAERRIPKLRALLESKESPRFKPSTLWGTIARRDRHEMALRRAEFRVVHGRSSGKIKSIIDPCDEPDFKPPQRPWPGRSPSYPSRLVANGDVFEAAACACALSDEAAARALSRHFGDFVKAAKELDVDHKDLRRLTWSNPAILDAAHERMSLFIFLKRDEIMCGLNSRVGAIGGVRLIEWRRNPVAVR